MSEQSTMSEGAMYFCDSPFWDWDDFWNADVPTLTDCFRHTILVFVPCIFLWIACIYNCLRARYDKSDNFELKVGPSPWTLLTIAKLVLDESRSFFRVHTGYFSNIPKCIKAEFIASWACSQSSVVSSSKR
ncbi:multidrug resistance-associated protein 1 [Trichonephila clavipes]|nr:multidrug resistance-associated protein 1 [Trichonephila clavipes]